MKYRVPQEAIDATSCPWDFGCLQTGNCSGNERCEILSADGENVLFVKAPVKETCKYCIKFGNSDVCTCPTRYSLYRSCGAGRREQVNGAP